MSSEAEIRAQIAELEARRYAAERAEAARLREEQQYQVQMAEAQAQLAGLQRDRMKAAFSEAVQADAAMVGENDHLGQSFLAAADAVAQQVADLVAPLAAQLSAIGENFDRQQGHKGNTLSDVEDRAWQEAVAGMTMEDRSRLAPDKLRALTRPFLDDLTGGQRLGNSLPAWAWLSLCIASAPDERTYQLRRAVILALTGKLYEVERGMSEADIRAVVNQQISSVEHRR